MDFRWGLIPNLPALGREQRERLVRLQVTLATWRRLSSPFFALGLTAALAWPLILLWPWSSAANLATSLLLALTALAYVQVLLEFARSVMRLKPLLSLRRVRFELTWSGYGLLNAFFMTNSMLGVIPLPGERMASILCVVGLGLFGVELLVGLLRS